MDLLQTYFVTRDDERVEGFDLRERDIMYSYMAFWALFSYFAFSMPRQNYLGISRYVSSVHSAILALLSALYLHGNISMRAWQRWQALPVGYLLYDLTLLLVNASTDWAMYLHHVAFLSFSGYFFPRLPREVTISYLSEITTPFFNAFFHYRSHNPKTAMLCASIVVLLWPFLRIANFSAGTVTCAVVYKSIPTTAAIGSITVMNVYWYMRILMKLWYAVKKRS